jgi:hypothetical protein
VTGRRRWPVDPPDVAPEALGTELRLLAFENRPSRDPGRPATPDRALVEQLADGHIICRHVSGRFAPAAASRGPRSEALLESLKRLAHRLTGAVVLAGMGGIGKSTIAAVLAPAPLLRSVSISGQSEDGPDRLWTQLDQARRGWLLIVDNADDPFALVPPAEGRGAKPTIRTASAADGVGWVRPSKRGLVLVTSRRGDLKIWGRPRTPPRVVKIAVMMRVVAVDRRRPIGHLRWRPGCPGGTIIVPV